MTKKKVKEEPTMAGPEDNNVPISLEQICAAIVKTLGSVEVSLEDLLANYADHSIAVNQNEETKFVTFSLVENPQTAE